MSDWLASIKGKKKAGVMKKNKKPFISLSSAPEAPKSQKVQAYEEMMERLEAMAKEWDKNYTYDYEKHVHVPNAPGIAEDPGLTAHEIVQQTEAIEGTDDAHDMFTEEMGIQKKKSNHCGQYKTSRYSCEDAGCKYSEGKNKKGEKTSYCRSPPTKKTNITSSTGVRILPPTSPKEQMTTKPPTYYATAPPVGLAVPIAERIEGMPMAHVQNLPMAYAQPMPNKVTPKKSPSKVTPKKSPSKVTPKKSPSKVTPKKSPTGIKSDSPCAKRPVTQCSPPTCKWANGERRQYCRSAGRTSPSKGSPSKAPLVPLGLGPEPNALPFPAAFMSSSKKMKALPEAPYSPTIGELFRR
jgi:hypothetical protein